MTDTEPTESKWRYKSPKARQEPAERLWAAVYALILLVVVVAITTVTYAQSHRRDLASETVLGFQRGAVNCMLVIVDNDREFQLPDYCERPEVIIYYPPEVCDAHFNRVNTCGEQWEGE